MLRSILALIAAASVAAELKGVPAGVEIPAGIPPRMQRKLERGVAKLSKALGKTVPQEKSAFGEKKELVETTHPVLKAAYAANGKLTTADFAAAAETPAAPKRAAPKKKKAVSRIGSINDDISSSDCDTYMHTTGCPGTPNEFPTKAVSRKLQEPDGGTDRRRRLWLPDGDGSTAGVDICFLNYEGGNNLEDGDVSEDSPCDFCCGACTYIAASFPGEQRQTDNSASGGCICTVLGDYDTSSFQGSAYNDCIFIPGDGNTNIYASTPASEASKERLPFPSAET